MSKAPLAHTHTTEKSSAGSIFKLLIDRGYSFAPNPPPPPPPKRPSLLHLCFRCCEDGVFRLLAHSSPNGFDDARSWAKPFRIAGAYKSEKKKKNSLRQRETTNVFGYFIPANCFAAENRKREREKVPFLSIRNERMIYTDRSRLVSNSGALPLFVREIVSKTRSSLKEINAEKSSERISKKEEVLKNASFGLLLLCWSRSVSRFRKSPKSFNTQTVRSGKEFV